MIVEFTGFLVEEDRRRDVRIRISGPHHDIAGDDSYFEVAAPEIFDRVERIFGVDEAQARKLAEAYLLARLDGKRLLDGCGNPIEVGMLFRAD